MKTFPMIFREEKCIDCGADFEQVEFGIAELCPLCRIAYSLRRLVDLKEEGF